jgi:hypothetical protein
MLQSRMLNRITFLISAVILVTISVHCVRPPSAPETFESSILAAEAYFENRIDKMDTSHALLFEFLHRKFKLPWMKPIAEKFQTDVKGDPESRISWVLRMFDASYESHILHNALDGTDRLLNHALYCKDRAFSEDAFFADIHHYTNLGQYELTHAAGAQEWAAELGCIGRTGRWAALRANQIRMMMQEAAHLEQVDDLYVNILSILYYVGAGKSVKPEWLAKVVSAQRTDGGWGARGFASESNDHTTLHAVWTLLEAALPSRLQVPMLKAIGPGQVAHPRKE